MQISSLIFEQFGSKNIMWLMRTTTEMCSYPLAQTAQMANL
jgi:hypothetical protein